jgi:hypothetical protein
MITQERLKELVTYETETGDFTRLKTVGSRISGTSFGCRTKLGYIKFKLDNYQTYGHRLAFLYMTGSMPKEIDHIDGNPSNNAWSNLREVTRGQNQFNRSLHKDSTSLVKGLSYKEQSQCWCAAITIEGKVYSKTLAASKDCIITKSVLTGWLLCARELLHGEYARYE